jgi:hypothetical protein
MPRIHIARADARARFQCGNRCNSVGAPEIENLGVALRCEANELPGKRVRLAGGGIDFWVGKGRSARDAGRLSISRERGGKHDLRPARAAIRLYKRSNRCAANGGEYPVRSPSIM